jgi:hypothetical protein
MVAFRSARRVLVGACAASVLGLCISSQALAGTNKTLDGVKAPGSTKDSPYAAPVDSDGSQAPGATSNPKNPTEALGGTKAAGSTKDSPYAAAKDDTSMTSEPTLKRLWTLVVPVGLAAGSYIVLRSRERGSIS